MSVIITFHYSSKKYSIFYQRSNVYINVNQNWRLIDRKKHLQALYETLKQTYTYSNLA